MIAEGAENEKLGQLVQALLENAHRLFLHALTGHVLADRHQLVEQPTLHKRGVVDAGAHLGDKILPDTRRRHQEVRGNLPDIRLHRLRAFRAIHPASRHQRAGQRPEGIADPGGRQVGQRFVGGIVGLDDLHALDRSNQVGVRQHGALGLPGGAGGVAEQRDIVGSPCRDMLVE